MLYSGFRSVFSIASTGILATTLAVSGCGHIGHPDVRLAVYNSLDQNDLRSVTVSQDRRAGTITLSGIVGANDRKQKAEELAQEAAPGYYIVDRIHVENTGVQSEITSVQQAAQLDSAIEDSYKAALAAHSDLKDVRYTAYNQTLTLKGKVKTYKERQEAEDLAKKVPQVQHVVNEIEILGGKPARANS